MQTGRAGNHVRMAATMMMKGMTARLHELKTEVAQARWTVSQMHQARVSSQRKHQQGG